MEKQYRPFKSNDRIEEGDQVQTVLGGEWLDFKPEVFDQIINPGLVSQSRKLIKSSDVQPKEFWTRDEVEAIIKRIVKDISYGEDYLLEHYAGDFRNLTSWMQQNLK